jgi:urease accessory protein
MNLIASQDLVKSIVARPGAGMAGSAGLVIAHLEGADRLVDLHQATPLRILFPYALPGDPLTAALVNTSGGLVGGDQLAVKIEIGASAAALVCAQAAEKVYRSLGPDSRIDLELTVGPAAWLEMLPQETILFDGARLRRQTRVDVALGGGFLGGEILVFGRQARGEQMHQGLVQDGWEVRRDGKPVWVDRLRLEGDIAQVSAASATLDAAVAAATLVAVAEDVARYLVPLRQLLADFPGRFAATLVNGVLVLRWLGTDPLVMRQSFATAWIFLRVAKKWPASLPRLWHI